MGKYQVSRIKYQAVVLGIRTNTMDATLVLLSSSHGLTGGSSELDRLTYPAGRQLSNTLLFKIEELLHRRKLAWTDLSGIVVYEGPGSFTSLRIGITIANTMAYSLGIPIVGVSSAEWVERGIKQLAKARPGQWVVPHYGAEANITKPKH